MKMTSNKPYLIRAFIDWITDNNLTTYITVDTQYPKVEVPVEFINKENNSITLNITAGAINPNFGLNIEEKFTTFSAKFGGKEEHLSFPTEAIAFLTIKETGQLIPLPMMAIEEVAELIGDTSNNDPQKDVKKDRSHLSIVKKK